MRILVAIIFILVVGSGANAEPQAQNMPMTLHAVHTIDMNPMEGHCATKGHQYARHCLCLACVPVVMQPIVLFLDDISVGETFDAPVFATMTDLITGPQPPPPRL